MGNIIIHFKRSYVRPHKMSKIREVVWRKHASAVVILLIP